MTVENSINQTDSTLNCKWGTIIRKARQLHIAPPSRLAKGDSHPLQVHVLSQAWACWSELQRVVKVNTALDDEALREKGTVQCLSVQLHGQAKNARRAAFGKQSQHRLRRRLSLKAIQCPRTTKKPLLGNSSSWPNTLR